MADRDDVAGCQAEGDPIVLVVEDDPEINELVGAYVRIAGFGYRQARNGQDALREALHRPALIVLDVMLPDLNGLEVCRRLKAQAITCDIPVMMLSAMDKDELRETCRECGVVEYMTKPFDPDRLMAAIRDHAREQVAP